MKNLNKMEGNFLLWVAKKGGNDFSLNTLPYDSAKEDFISPEIGEENLSGWPKDVFFKMSTVGLTKSNAKKYSESSNRPSGMLPVVSGKVKKILIDEKTKDVEFLSVFIEPTLGRKKPEVDYYILNPLKRLDFIDTKASQVRWNELNPDKILDFKQLIVSEIKIPKSTVLFLAHHFGNRIFIAEALANKLKEQCDDLKFWELESIKGIDNL